MEKLKQRLSKTADRIRIYNKIANISQITRRYFAINGFDGVITIIGVLIGNFIIGTQDFKHIIIAGSAVCISLGVSGVWSAYNSESAERAKEIKDLEAFTLHDLDGTIISKAQNFASRVLAVINGFSAGATAFLPLLPFFFAKHIDINTSYYIGFGIAFIILIGIGVFLGKVSKRNIVFSALKMVAAGIFCVLLSFLLELID